MVLPRIYFFLSILGAIIPFCFFIPFASEHGIGIPVFFRSIFVNDASSGITADLFLSSVAFGVFVIFESRRHGLKFSWIYVMINIVIALSCALPLFLYFREKKRLIIESDS